MPDQQIWDGVWFHAERSFRLVCCHCSLVHDVDIRLKKTKKGYIKVEMKMSQHPKSTAARRRSYGLSKEED
jgi:hypothetical protein